MTPLDPNAVADEQLAAEHAEKKEPLQDADKAVREVRALQRVPGVLQTAEQKRKAAEAEKAYKAALDKIPDKKKSDPWGSVR